jgi:alginate O-acetyltransferase complex protein AlgJ
MDDRTPPFVAPSGDPAPSPPRTPGDLVVIVVFALLLLAPAALALAGLGGADQDFIYYSEMRQPFVAPPVSTGALATGGWERDLERQIADRFPLRRRLIESYDVTKYAWLGDVASSHVTRGADGWLFFGDEERRYDDGTFAPTGAQLARLAAVYQARADWCARRGIAYVFVLVPNKSTVYARYLPSSVRHVTPTAGERLIPLVRARGVHAIDLRTALTEAAAHATTELYSKGETHWNDAGAYVGYREIVRELRSAGAPHGAREMRLHGSEVRDTIDPASLKPRIELADGDLDRLAGITPLVHNDILRYDFPRHAHEAAPPAYPGDPIAGAFIPAAYAVNDPRLPKAVVFGDSFSIALRGFLAEDFSRTVILQHGIASALQFDRAAVEAEKPAVVIQELIERALVYGDRFEP